MRIRDLGRFSGPTVLLLHDSLIPAQHLERLAAALALRRRVLLPDLPGYGGSPPVRTLAEATSLLERELGQLFVGEAVDVVGLGLGAYRALLLALSGNLDVRRIVTVGGFAALTEDERRRCLAQADLVAAGTDLCDVVIQGALPAEHRDADPGLVERCRAWVHDCPPATRTVELDAMSSCADLRPRMRDLRSPLLALHGLDDGLVPEHKSDELAAATARAFVEKLPCGHLSLEELPDRVIPRIRGFLSS